MVIAAFVLWPASSTSTLVFGAGIGLLWLATIPLTSGIVAQQFGTANAGALFGIVAEYLPFHPPRGLVNTIYLTFGLSFLVFIPWMLDGLTVNQFVVLLIGGAFYGVGSIIVGAQWPDPWTDVFGYHEIWHVFVVVAVLLHAALAVSLAW